MNTKYTPGPWIHSPVSEEGHFDIESADRSTLVCSGAGFYGDTCPAAANARLIAASPELLEALQRAVEYLKANRPKGKVTKIFSQLNEHENGVLKPALIAIAKATGQTL